MTFITSYGDDTLKQATTASNIILTQSLLSTGSEEVGTIEMTS